MSAVVAPIPTRRRDDIAQAPGADSAVSRPRLAVPPQPVVLQIAPVAVDIWTDVVRYDGRDHDACGVIEYHAPGVAVVGRARLRVVSDSDPQRAVLRSWSIETGWKSEAL